MRAKRKASIPAPDAAELGPMHQREGTAARPGLRRLEVVYGPDAGEGGDPNRTVRRARVADPLRRMVRAGMRYRCMLAADRFRHDLEQAQAMRGVGSQLRPRIAVGPPAGADMPLGALAAQARVRRAWQAIGLDLSGVFAWCVVPRPEADGGPRYRTIEGYALMARLRRQRAAEMLDAALHRLADHYDLGDPDPPPEFRDETERRA